MEDKMYFPSRCGNLVQKPFQTGIIVGINSTVSLYNDLKSEGIHFVLTSRLNQDALENTFSTLRLMGGSNSHPTALEVSNRIRKLCITKNVCIVANNPSVEITDNDEHISADLFDKGGFNIF